ncbi:MAG: hybrid sensor histidine kinase/response regulator, partial [Planctomycetaceae bacterium]
MEIENSELRRRVESLANANAYAAELLAALEEALEREDRLVRRQEELALQTRLDTLMQQERQEEALLAEVCRELRGTPGLRLELAHWQAISDRNDTDRDPPANQPAVWSANALDIPVVHGGRLLALLRLTVTDPDSAWRERWTSILESAGSQLGMALQRLRVERENQRIQAELITARDSALEASRAKSAFLANISHELRTPLCAIIGFAELLVEQSPRMRRSEMLPDLQKIEGAGRHLMALINDVLDLSKIEAGKTSITNESFSVRRAIDSVVGLIAPLLDKNRNQLIVHCPDEPGRMNTDLVKLRQVLFNLLSNANKFSEGGQIELSVEVSRLSSGERLIFRVSDNGIGMSPSQLARLFRPFSQVDESSKRRSGGTGLGLAISRRFCQLMGGEIRVRSELGKGSTFTVELPREAPRQVDDEVASRSGDPPGAVRKSVTGRFRSSRSAQSSGTLPVGGLLGSGPLILVIDDSREMQELMVRQLAERGYRVLVAESGEEGLELARRLQPAAVLLDVLLPGQSGWQVLQAARADTRIAATPVIVVSILEHRDEVLSHGAIECLTKPVDWNRLKSLLGQCTGHGRERRILVVEDNANSSELARRLFEEEGWVVELAANGLEAMSHLERQSIDVVVLDLMMPELDGFELLDRLDQRSGVIVPPIIVVSSRSLTTADRQRLEGRVAAILVKGQFRRAELLGLARKIVFRENRTGTSAANQAPCGLFRG